MCRKIPTSKIRVTSRRFVLLDRTLLMFPCSNVALTSLFLTLLLLLFPGVSRSRSLISLSRPVLFELDASPAVRSVPSAARTKKDKINKTVTN